MKGIDNHSCLLSDRHIETKMIRAFSFYQLNCQKPIELHCQTVSTATTRDRIYST